MKKHDIREIDIRAEIINKRTGVYYFDIKQNEEIKKKLKEVIKEGLLDKYNMSYVKVENNSKIMLGIHRAFDFL